MTQKMSDKHLRGTTEAEMSGKETRAQADKHARSLDFAGIEGPHLRTPGGVPEPKPKRSRKPNLTKAIKEAAQAGLSVTGATIEAGRITLQFGQQCGDTAKGNELDDWLSTHRERDDLNARSIKGH